MKKKNIKKSKKITFTFLQDVKHDIYYPNVIEIFDTDYNLIKELNIRVDSTDLAIKEVSLRLPTKFDDKQLPSTFIIKINKRSIAGKNALACDEIIFN